MTRLYGRAPKSERIKDYVPDVRFQRVSILSTVRLNGDKNPLVFSGTLNASFFKKYIEEVLFPSLSPNDILLLDNSSVHTARIVREAFEKCRFKVIYLPKYSPDFNPIEMMWSKLKAFLRKMKARTYDKLMEALKLALEYITVDDISAWFKHDGYSI